MASKTSEEAIFTMGAIGDRYGFQAWRLRSLIERGLAPQPHRAGRVAFYYESELPGIEKALREAGCIK